MHTKQVHHMHAHHHMKFERILKPITREIEPQILYQLRIYHLRTTRCCHRIAKTVNTPDRPASGAAIVKQVEA
jgi:hypothetical protein